MKIAHFVATLAALLIASNVVFGADGTEAVDQAWRKAVVANDLDAIVACYAKDAVLWLPNAPAAKGQDAIRKCYADMLGANKVTDATLTNTHYEVAGSTAVGWGEFSVKMSPKAGGDPVTMSGRFSVVAKKEAGKWVYVLDHASSDAAKSQ
jgi:uncharacterized protein (TIGR02246 family)